MAIRSTAVSLRLSESERNKLKAAATRLDVREADVLRYAIEMSLNRLGPLLDPQSRGGDLLPLFVETGDELLRHFRIDAERLDAIINGGIETPDDRVESRDLVLLIRLWRGHPTARVQLEAMFGNPEAGDADPRALKERLREYLYRKYIYNSRLDSAVGV